MTKNSLVKSKKIKESSDKLVNRRIINESAPEKKPLAYLDFLSLLRGVLKSFE